MSAMYPLAVSRFQYVCTAISFQVTGRVHADYKTHFPKKILIAPFLPTEILEYFLLNCYENYE